MPTHTRVGAVPNQSEQVRLQLALPPLRDSPSFVAHDAPPPSTDKRRPALLLVSTQIMGSPLGAAFLTNGALAQPLATLFAKTGPPPGHGPSDTAQRIGAYCRPVSSVAAERCSVTGSVRRVVPSESICFSRADTGSATHITCRLVNRAGSTERLPSLLPQLHRINHTASTRRFYRIASTRT